MKHHHIFSFSAVVGQEKLKLALILNAVNPQIGGVLIRGEKGTAKSTTVRALSSLLPGTQVVTLPLNATEDRVAGGIDFSLAVKSGKRAFQPGLLAKAHQGILYVDEVNLLDDHIVDIILDASASKENRVEREGISFCHDADFILVGTMNPEEGELRPQLLDRFGLCVEVTSEKDLETRILLMLRKESFDADPEGFCNQYQADNTALSEQIATARTLLKEVQFPDSLRALVAGLCAQNNVAGHRADLVIEQTAKALAAFHGRVEAGMDEVKQVAWFALAHRKRDQSPAPPPPPDHSPDNNNESNNNEPEENKEKPESPEPNEQDQDKQDQGRHDHGEQEQDENNTDEDQDGQDEEQPAPEPEPRGENQEQDKKDVLEKIFEVGETFKVKKFVSPKDQIFRRGSGKRSRSRTAAKQGRYVRSTTPKGSNDIAFDATLRAAAPFQIQRKDSGSAMAVILKNQDIREKIREKRIGNFLLFIVDASASMGARGRMKASKGAIMSLLLDAYQKRDKVAMVTFRKEQAFVNLPPTSSVELAGKLLEEMPVGGKTPLSSGLVKGFELLRNHLLREPEARPIAIIITDGRGNVALGNKKPFQEVLDLAEKMALEPRIQFIVVDSESQGAVSFGLAQKLAANLNAEYCKIQDLKVNQLIDIARGDLF
ncbi:MAG: magnesium chelatase subunit D family protein [Proteobacteria bacterium]|nr:magnesium chelatase subunit D family protein [Pseudomonadota bacterium]MBU1585229.1 magnesium chelatase subunit D family protein [Pseudomonadota bacterium]MBU2454542.1 magnesium chelatase subunit D family protein [Pseudomonadota bacterium]MBU2629119.1 magnesium chelatase subunit D family protein [Pseudomonadota bacterium]